ncbi:amidase signature domain-containing protein [Fusarium solani]|uniref:Amidase signature domain-containing protein n=1 Tax=Fusarium solani TaxID=169388 RepID=A0A9P9JV06_FUSSL|nr:amidase signature domain-containing protein [Fusarium solani]KAH7234311.1 amidase signature domain-containing protein [Fusarium solani]
MKTLNLVGASIDDLQAALSSGSLTSVELVALYLRRVARYDCHGLALNSIPILNQHVFDEAAASDDRRANEQPVGRLEGIPYTVKDSYKVQGMTVASGSPAFKDLIANEDAFTVSAIRAEGGVLIGRTNMPPMAYGGMQRGVYGRAESPYNPACLAAAWASGSSNGSAVSTAASMAAFGMAEETVSSGRSPASNNALIAYTPSRGWLSIRGNWPLYPTCDVVVPHTRTIDDLLRLLEVIAEKDPLTGGDFWRHQPFIKLAEPWGPLGPTAELFQSISEAVSLKGRRIAVPSMYIGGPTPHGATPVFTSDAVTQLWQHAQRELEALGAEIVVVPDFPAVTGYENPSSLPEGSARLPDDWNWYERGPMVAHGWESFLHDNADPKLSSLSCVDEFNIFPHSMRTLVELKHLFSYTCETSMFETKNLETAVNALEAMRKQLVDDYLDEYKCDFFVFPCQGDVAAADSDIDPDAAAHAWKNGVWYSHGNRASRHLGIPSVTVPMGIMAKKQMPVGLTFAGRAYDDADLLRWANAFEKRTRLRIEPPHTPALDSDVIQLKTAPEALSRQARPLLHIETCEASPHGANDLLIKIRGTLQVGADVQGAVSPVVEVTVNGEDIPSGQIHITSHSNSASFEVTVSTSRPTTREAREQTMEPVARDKTMVVVLARATSGGRPSGILRLV